MRFYLILGAGVATSVAAAISLAVRQITSHEVAAIIVSVVVAVAGWLISARQSRIQLQQQHTIDILLDSRLSETFDSHHDRVYAKLLSMTVPAKRTDKYPAYASTILDLTSDPQFRLSVMFLANFYEFVATALNRGYLSEDVLRDTYRQRMCGFYTRLEPYIDQVRTRNVLAYESLRTVCERWCAGADPGDAS